ncbi:MAG: RNA polymerase sigma factor RpoH, partial [Pseudomonadota bacterium]
GLQRYLYEIRKFPMLEASEEFELAKRWRDDDDQAAAHQLVTSHLRLVARIAMGYRGYGLPMSELISEGNIGMMHAVKRFDPDRGFRLATYAMWWIKASIHEYVLRSWSLVKIGTTAAQKKLFFNLRRIKARLKILDEHELSPEHVQQIAQELNVSEHDVVSMNQRLATGDQSLNAKISHHSSESAEWQDWLEDETPNQEELLSERQQQQYRRELLEKAMASLQPRERRIIKARRLSDEPLTLETLSHEFSVTRERIRQIELRAFEKLKLAAGKLAAGIA